MRVLMVLLMVTQIVGFSQIVKAQEIRLGAEVDYKISKKNKMEVMYQQRLSEHNMRAESSTIIQSKVNHKQNKNFSYTLGFRYKKSNLFSAESYDISSDKYRLTADVKIKIPEHIKNLSIYNRVRFQQTLASANNQWFLVRNQSMIKYSYSKNLSTNIGYELFYNTNIKALILGRLKFNISYDLSKRFSCSGYFMVDAPIGNNKFDHYYVMGSKLKYSI